MMQENYEYINGDSVVSTIQFDAIDISTRQLVTLANHEADQPTIDFKLFPSGLGFQQEVDVVEGDTVDYVIKQTFVKKTISLTLMWKGESAFLKYKNLKEVHILSSIPSNGLLYLGKKMASYEYDHLNFYIYNYSKDNDRYELGTILNTNLLEGC